MDIFTLAMIACACGALFCFFLAGGVAQERPGESPAHEMLNLFKIQP